MIDLDREPLFKVVEPDGKERLMYANGKIEGFAPGAVAFNSYPIFRGLEIERALGRVDEWFASLTDEELGQVHQKCHEEGLRRMNSQMEGKKP